MAQWPKMIYKKGEPERTERVGRSLYYRRIYEGWGVVSAAKLSKRLRQIMDSFGMDRQQFWEFLNLRIDDIPISRDAVWRVLSGSEHADSRVDYTFLMVMATATSQPFSWFTQEKELAVRKPWRLWDFGKAKTRARKLAFFQVEFASNLTVGDMLVTAYDITHARGLIKARYPDIQVIDIHELPAQPGIEIR